MVRDWERRFGAALTGEETAQRARRGNVPQETKEQERQRQQRHTGARTTKAAERDGKCLAHAQLAEADRKSKTCALPICTLCSTFSHSAHRSLLFPPCTSTLSHHRETCFRFAPQQSQLKHRLRSGTNCLLHLDMHHHQVWVLGAAWCSCISCTWLLVHLYRVPASVRNRLFLVQIRYLALADLFFVVSNVPSVFVEGLWALSQRRHSRKCVQEPTVADKFLQALELVD